MANYICDNCDSLFRSAGSGDAPRCPHCNETRDIRRVGINALGVCLIAGMLVVFAAVALGASVLVAG